MLSKREMSARLKELGLKKAYKPMWVGDTGDGPEENAIGLESRKFGFKDGSLKGASFTIMKGHVDVWTSQKKKAADTARQHGFPVTLLDYEAILRIPFAKADKFLHGFGAKVKAKRVLTPEQKAALVARLAKVREARAKEVTFKIPPQPAQPAREMKFRLTPVRKKRSRPKD